MQWDEIFGFMCSRSPSFAKDVIGVPQKAIDTVEQRLEVTLPAMYKDMLVTLGEKSPGYTPFGPTASHDFYDLVDRMPSKRFPNDRFFRVAIHVGTLIDPEDVFIELTEGTDGDTRLMTILPGKFSEESVLSLDLTLVVSLAMNAFSAFDLQPKAERSNVWTLCDTLDEVREIMMQGASLMKKMGLRQALSPLPDYICATKDSRALCARNVEDDSVLFEVGADDKATVGTMVEQLLDAFPGSETQDVPASPADEGTPG